MILIGIDPGTTTGFAVYDTGLRALTRVDSLPIHRAMTTVLLNRDVLVIFEDARMRTWFGNAGREKLQGVGSVKRDCSIWEDFLSDEGIAYQAHRPAAHCTKWMPDYFKRHTGWTARTSEHGRDAAILVYGINEPMALGMRRAWEQSRANKATGT